jgi:hypothetical protein
MQDGKVVRVIGNIMDITERKRVRKSCKNTVSIWRNWSKNAPHK